MRVTAPPGAVSRGRVRRLGGRPKGERSGEKGGKKRMSQVTSLPARRRVLRVALAVAPASRSRGSSRSSPRSVRETFAEAWAPRSSRLANNPPSRLACRLRKPPAAAVAGLVDAPLRVSRSRPGILGRETQVPRSVRAPADRLAAPDFRRRLRQPPAARSAAPLAPAFRVRLQSAFAEAPASLPPVVSSGIRLAASHAACGEPPAARSAEPSNSTTWDNFNTTRDSEQCQCLFQANFKNLRN